MFSVSVSRCKAAKPENESCYSIHEQFSEAKELVCSVHECY